MSDKRPLIKITVSGPQGAGKSTIAYAICEMLARSEIAATVNNEESTHSGAIKGLRSLRGGPRILIIDHDALAGDSNDHRRDFVLTECVLEVLQNAGLREKDAIATAKAIVNVVERTRR